VKPGRLCSDRRIRATVGQISNSDLDVSWRCVTSLKA
jgi:hypothetical protein